MENLDPWLGHGAKPFTDAEAAPGTYYVPSPHPYQATLPGGIKVQEAYPGQYYEPNPGMSGMGALPQLPFPRWMCAVAGGLLVAGAAFAGGKAFVKNKKPKLPLKKLKQIPMYWAAGGLGAGALVGWLLCGKPEELPPPGDLPPPQQPPPELPPPSMPPAQLTPSFVLQPMQPSIPPPR
jgi:hypothetical protein